MQKRFVACLGWSFYLMSIVIFSWNSVSGWSFDVRDGSTTFVFNLVRFVSFSLGFFFGALLARVTRGQNGLKGALIGSVAIVVVGSAVMQFPALGAAGMVTGAICLGLGSAALFMGWQEWFAHEGSYRSCFLLAIASALGVTLYFAVSLASFFGSPLLCAACGLLVSACCLGFESFLAKQSGENVQLRDFASGSKGIPAHFWKPILCVSAFAFVWQIVYAFGLKNPSMATALQNSFVVSQIIASLALLVAWSKYHDSINIETVFQILFPLMATGFLLVPFLGLFYQTAFVALSLFAFGLMSILMQVVCVQEYEKRHVNPLLVFGIFAGFVYASMTLGFVVGHYLPNGDEFGFAHVLVLALVLVYGLSLVLFMVKFHWKEPRAEKEGKELAGYVQSCAGLAEQYGLSARETEVLELIVRGRDLPTIAGKLYVSKNTVRTHMKNIYQKLGVHSKQEVLDLIEGRD